MLMIDTAVQWIITLVFGLANVVILCLILHDNRRPRPTSELDKTKKPLPWTSNDPSVSASGILEWEFEYIRTTASEAMEQRHTMVNFYLLVVGVIVSGVVTVLSQDGLPKPVGAVLMWLLCCIGWIYYLSVIHLRQAWYGSVQAMNQIKDFCIQHSTEFRPEVLKQAFAWRRETLPEPARRWTVFYYSAILIAFLDSVAFVAGGALINWSNTQDKPLLVWGPLTIMGIGFLGFHVRLYYDFLKTRSPNKARQPDPTHGKEDSNVPTPPPMPHPTGPWVEIIQETVAYTFHKLFRIVEARLRFRRFDGRMSEPITRILFERGDAVGVVLYDAEQEAVVLVRQFRYPVYVRLSPEEQAGAGAQKAWILEVVAGMSSPDQPAPEVGRRELLEEAGYTVQGDLKFIATIYPSPGGSSERIHMYWGEVSATGQTHVGGGLEEEGEDTQVVTIPFQAAMDMIASGEIQDAKTILALQHLALHKS
jgi:nudix-type nucleoside diphosphatase (YffH/AdpP family)